MSVIRKLSPEIIGQIAAGEVVERPAAAVKELVENSIDAGAKNITIELREGGIRYLRVSDNGRGIPAEQIRMAFERHATSKISEARDLFDIQTLGFRGEALASIAAVAKVTCTTRTQDAAFGTRAVVEAGEFTDIRQAASPVGTTIVAEDLFYNTPVRLKFLKKPATEAAMVSDYVLRLILSHPEIAFRYVSQGKTIFHSMGDGKIESALYSIYGREAFQQMRKVSGHMNGVLLEGYVGAGELSRGNRQHQSFFVNGRYFRSGALSQALEKGCDGRVMVGRFPMCALFLEVPRQQVDVNVHPNKLEVRFQNEIGVAAAVEALVRDSMHAETLGARLTQPQTADSVVAEPKAIPKPRIEIIDFPSEKAVQTETVSAEFKQSAAKKNEETVQEIQTAIQKLKPIVVKEAAKEQASLHEAASPVVARMINVIPPRIPSAAKVYEPPKTSVPKERIAPPSDFARTKMQAVVQPAPRSEQSAEKPMIQPVQPTLAISQESEQPVQETLQPAEQAAKPLRMVGILFDTYWVFETEDRVLLVDQHAAHERILFDQMMSRFENEKISQKLLSPLLVTLTPHDMTLVSEFTPVLEEAGFEVEVFDRTSVALHAIPTFFGVNESPQSVFLEALSEWQAGRTQVTQERLRRTVAQMACKRAIKGGDKLSETEVQGFMQEMLKSDVMPTCPHGRPIVIEMTRYALEKRFKRIQ